MLESLMRVLFRECLPPLWDIMQFISWLWFKSYR